MGTMYSSGGSATERFHHAVTDARDGVTATVESAPNGATIVSDVGDNVRDATNGGAHRAADAKELVQEKAHDGVAALRRYRRAARDRSDCVGGHRNDRAPGGASPTTLTTPSSLGRSTAGLVGL